MFEENKAGRNNSQLNRSRSSNRARWSETQPIDREKRKSLILFDQSAIQPDGMVGDDNILFSVCEEENEMLFENLDNMHQNKGKGKPF